jgi:hypothetical protein
MSFEKQLTHPNSAIYTADSEYETGPERSADKAFNGLMDPEPNEWVSSSSVMPHWLKVDFGANNTKKATKYRIMARTTTNSLYYHHPTTWTFDGSNDDSSWTTLDTQTSVTTWTTPSATGTSIDEDSAFKTFTINNNDYYRYYRFYETANIQGSNYGSVSNFEIHGYDYETDPVHYTHESQVYLGRLDGGFGSYYTATPTGTAFSSSEFSASYPASDAFNGTVSDSTDAWHSESGDMADGAHLGYQFANPVIINKYRIITRLNATNSYPEFVPKTWQFQGSNDGSTYTTIDYRTNITNWSKPTTIGYTDDIIVNQHFKTFCFANTTKYTYYRILITSSGGRISDYSEDDFVAISELEMHGPITNNIILGRANNGKHIVPSGSAFGDSGTPSNAFNGSMTDSSDVWASGSGLPVYVGYDFDTSVVINSYAIMNRYSSTVSYYPRTWLFQGSNTSETSGFTTLHSVSNYDDWEDPANMTAGDTDNSTVHGHFRHFSCKNTDSYQYYRIYVTGSHGLIHTEHPSSSSDEYVRISEIEFYGKLPKLVYPETSGFVASSYIEAESEIVPMTFFSSSVQTGAPERIPDKIFSGKFNADSDHWHSQSDGSDLSNSNFEYIGFTFGDNLRYRLIEYSLMARSTSVGSNTFEPDSWKFQGTNSGDTSSDSVWTTLDTQSSYTGFSNKPVDGNYDTLDGSDDPNYNKFQRFNISNNNYYCSYRLRITKNIHSTNKEWVTLGQFEMKGFRAMEAEQSIVNRNYLSNPIGQLIEGYGSDADTGFCCSISSNGSYLALGSPWYGSTNVGAIRVYKYIDDGTGWSQQTISSDDVGTVTDENFGWSCSISGDATRLVVGNPMERIDHIGYLRIYHRSGSTWSIENTINANSGGEEWFGRSSDISRDGTVIVSGGPLYDNGSYINSGKAELFKYDGSDWFAAGKIISDRYLSYYGRVTRVSDDGSRLVASAAKDDTSSTNSGRVVIYDMETTAVANLDGSTTYLEIPYTANLNTTDFTVAVWAFPTSREYEAIYSSRENPSTGYTLYKTNTGTWELQAGDTSIWNVTTAVNVEYDTWQHIIISKSGTTFKTYFNGSLVETDTISSTVSNTTSPFRLGAGKPETTATYFFGGEIHDFRWFNHEITLEEAQQIYQSSDLIGDEVLALFRSDLSTNDGSLSVTITNYSATTTVTSAGIPRVIGDLHGPNGWTFYGLSIAISGDGNRIAILGLTDESATETLTGYIGFVEVYEYRDSLWYMLGSRIYTKNYYAITDDTRDYGHVLSFSSNGNVLLIGDPGHRYSSGVTGRSYVYRYSGTDWYLVREFIGEDESNAAGTSVDTTEDGNIIAYGDRLSDSAGNASGTGRVYNVGKNLQDGRYIEDNITINNGSINVSVDPSNNWYHTQKLKPWDSADLASTSYLGYSAAISPDRSLIVSGATNLNSQGGLFVYENSGLGTSYTWTQTIVSNDIQASDGFGNYCDTDGKSIIVGAPNEDTNGSAAGAVYIFTKNSSGVWTQQQKLTGIYSTNSDDNFGWCVQIVDDKAYVGSLTKVTGFEGGGIYCYRRISGTWYLEQFLFPSQTQSYDRISREFAIDKSNKLPKTIVAGALHDDGAGSNAGTAYIYNMDVPCGSFTGSNTNTYLEIDYTSELNTTEFSFSFWVYPMDTEGSNYESVLTSRSTYIGYVAYIDPSNNWLFVLGTGSSWVNLSGPSVTFAQWTHICITRDSSTNGMKLYINGSLYTQQTVSSYSPNTTYPFRIGAGTTETTPSYYYQGQIHDLRFYNHVITSGEVTSVYNKEILGDESLMLLRTNDYFLLNEGSVSTTITNYNNTKNIKAWQYKQELTATGISTGDNFGNSVAINNNTIAIGAPYKNSGDRGAVFIYKCNSGGVWNEIQEISGSGLVGYNDNMGEKKSLGISGTTIFIGCFRYNARAYSGILFVYTYDSSSGTWTHAKSITEGSGVHLGFSVAAMEDLVAAGSYKEDLNSAEANSGAVFLYRLGSDFGNLTNLAITNNGSITANIVDAYDDLIGMDYVTTANESYNNINVFVTDNVNVDNAYRISTQVENITFNGGITDTLAKHVTSGSSTLTSNFSTISSSDGTINITINTTVTDSTILSLNAITNTTTGTLTATVSGTYDALNLLDTDNDDNITISVNNSVSVLEYININGKTSATPTVHELADTLSNLEAVTFYPVSTNGRITNSSIDGSVGNITDINTIASGINGILTANVVGTHTNISNLTTNSLDYIAITVNDATTVSQMQTIDDLTSNNTIYSLISDSNSNLLSGGSLVSTISTATTANPHVDVTVTDSLTSSSHVSNLNVLANATSGSGSTLTATITQTANELASLVTSNTTDNITITVSDGASASEALSISDSSTIAVVYSGGLSDTVSNLATGTADGSISSGFNAAVIDDPDVDVTVSDSNLTGSDDVSYLNVISNATTGDITATISRTASNLIQLTTSNSVDDITITVTDDATASEAQTISHLSTVGVIYSGGLSDSISNLISGSAISAGVNSATIDDSDVDITVSDSQSGSTGVTNLNILGSATSGTITATLTGTASQLNSLTTSNSTDAISITVSDDVTASEALSISNSSTIAVVYSGGLSDSSSNIVSGSTVTAGVNSAIIDDTDINITVSDEVSGSSGVSIFNTIVNATGWIGDLTGSIGATASELASLTTNGIDDAITINVTDGASISQSIYINDITNATITYYGGLSDSIDNLLSGTTPTSGLLNANSADPSLSITVTDESNVDQAIVITDATTGTINFTVGLNDIVSEYVTGSSAITSDLGTIIGRDSNIPITVNDSLSVGQGELIANASTGNVQYQQGITDTLTNFSSSGSITADFVAITGNDSNVNVTISDSSITGDNVINLNAVADATNGIVTATISGNIVQLQDITTAITDAITINVTDYVSTSQVNILSTKTSIDINYYAGLNDSIDKYLTTANVVTTNTISANTQTENIDIRINDAATIEQGCILANFTTGTLSFAGGISDSLSNYVIGDVGSKEQTYGFDKLITRDTDVDLTVISGNITAETGEIIANATSSSDVEFASYLIDYYANMLSATDDTIKSNQFNIVSSKDTDINIIVENQVNVTQAKTIVDSTTGTVSFTLGLIDFISNLVSGGNITISLGSILSKQPDIDIEVTNEVTTTERAIIVAATTGTVTFSFYSSKAVLYDADTDLYYTDFETEIFANATTQSFTLKADLYNTPSTYDVAANGSLYASSEKFEDREWGREFSNWDRISHVTTNSTETQFLPYYNTNNIEYYGWTILNSNYWKHSISDDGNPRDYIGNNTDISGNANFFYHTDSSSFYEIRSNSNLYHITINSITQNAETGSTSVKLAKSNFRRGISNDISKNVLVMDNTLLKDDSPMLHSITTHAIPIEFSTESDISGNSSLYNALMLEYTSSYFWNDVESAYNNSPMDISYVAPTQHLQSSIDEIQKGKVYITFLESLDDGPKSWYLVDEVNYNMKYDFIFNVAKNINLNKISEYRRSLITLKNDINSTSYTYVKIRFTFETLHHDAGWWAIGSMKLAKKTITKQAITGSDNEYMVQIDGTNALTGNPVIYDNITNYSKIITIDDGVAMNSTLNYIIEKLQISAANIYPSYVNISKDVSRTLETSDNVLDIIYHDNLFRDITYNSNLSAINTYENSSLGSYSNFNRNNNDIYSFQIYNKSSNRVKLMDMITVDRLDSLRETIACGENPNIRITKDVISSNYSDLRYNSRQSTIQICNNATTCNISDNYDSFSFLAYTGKSVDLITNNTAIVRLEWTSNTVTVNRESGSVINTYDYDNYTNLIRLGSKDYVAHSNPMVMEQLRVSENSANPTITTNSFIPYSTITSNDFMEKQGWYCEKHLKEKMDIHIGESSDIFDIRTRIRADVVGNVNATLHGTENDESKYYYPYYTTNYQTISTDYPFDGNGWHYETIATSSLYTPSTEIPTTYNGESNISVIRFGSDSSINIGNYPIHFDLPNGVKYIVFDFLFKYLYNAKYSEIKDVATFTEYYQEINNIAEINLEGSTDNSNWTTIYGLTLSQKNYTTAQKDIYLYQTKVLTAYEKLRLSVYFDTKTLHNVYASSLRQSLYFCIWNIRYGYAEISNKFSTTANFNYYQIKEDKIEAVVPSNITSAVSVNTATLLQNMMMDYQWSYVSGTDHTDNFGENLWHYDYVTKSDITSNNMSGNQLVIKMGKSTSSGLHEFETQTTEIIHNIVNPSSDAIDKLKFKYHIANNTVSGNYAVSSFTANAYTAVVGNYTSSTLLDSLVVTINGGTQYGTTELTLGTPSDEVVLVLSSVTNDNGIITDTSELKGIHLYDFETLNSSNEQVSQSINAVFSTFRDTSKFSEYVLVHNANNPDEYKKYIFNLQDKTFHSADYTSSEFPDVFVKDDYILYINQHNNFMAYVKLNDIVDFNYFIRNASIDLVLNNKYETEIVASVDNYTPFQYLSTDESILHHWIIVRDTYSGSPDERYQYINKPVESEELDEDDLLSETTPSQPSSFALYDGYIIYIDKLGYYNTNSNNITDSEYSNDYNTKMLFKNILTGDIVSIPIDYTTNNSTAAEYVYVITTGDSTNYYLNLEDGTISTTVPSVFNEYNVPHVLAVNQETSVISYYNIKLKTSSNVVSIPTMYTSNTNSHWIVSKRNNIELYYNFNNQNTTNISSPPSATLTSGSDNFMYRIYYDIDIGKILFRNTSTGAIIVKPSVTTVNYENSLLQTFFSPVEWHLFIYIVDGTTYYKYVNLEKQYVTTNKTIMSSFLKNNWILAIYNKATPIITYYNISTGATQATVPSDIDIDIYHEVASDWMIILNSGVYYYYNIRSGELSINPPTKLNNYKGILLLHKKDTDTFMYKKIFTGEEFAIPDFTDYNDLLYTDTNTNYWNSTVSGEDIFYYNRMKDEVSATIPKDLIKIADPHYIDGWVNGIDTALSNKMFYYNLHTLTLTWNAPDDLSRLSLRSIPNSSSLSSVTTMSEYMSYLNTKYSGTGVIFSLNTETNNLYKITVTISSTATKQLYEVVDQSFINFVKKLTPTGYDYKIIS